MSNCFYFFLFFTILENKAIIHLGSCIDKKVYTTPFALPVDHVRKNTKNVHRLTSFVVDNQHNIGYKMYLTMHLALKTYALAKTI